MSDVQDNHDQAPTVGRLLQIVSGLHAGASRELAEREMILVGSGDDCDIVLADNGVAAHHALISVVDGHFHLRALDAPLKLEGRVLHPGDPVEMDRPQRIGLGEAALAFGHEDDPAWLALAPEGGASPASRRRDTGIPFTRRLPMIAAISVLCLASLAIFAAVMPSAEQGVDPEARLKALATQFHVSGARIGRDVNGRPVLSGMVTNAAAEQRLREQIAAENLEVGLTLTTGESLAGNVAEILRGGGFAARTRYLGRGEVEATGYFEDMAAFDEHVRSDAMVATGVRRVVPNNLFEGAQEQVAPDDQEPVRIVAYERGDDPHLIDAQGRQYRPGMHVPGWGVLRALGRTAQATGPDNEILRIDVRPMTAEEKGRASNAAPEAAADPGRQAGQTTARSRAYAAEQARAAAQRQ